MASTPIREVGGVPILERHRLSCHCGGVVIELELPAGLVEPRRCTCSICRRKGAVMASVPLAGLRILEGASLLSSYRFNTRTAEHYFCSRCGIYTHHRRRSRPDEYGFNVGCLEGVQPTAIRDVRVNDGVSHPSDRPAEGRSPEKPPCA